jgi:hypothetical protein
VEPLGRPPRIVPLTRREYRRAQGAYAWVLAELGTYRAKDRDAAQVVALAALTIGLLGALRAYDRTPALRRWLTVLRHHFFSARSELRLDDVFARYAHRPDRSPAPGNARVRV